MSFSQINLHKAALATDMAGRELEGKKSSILLVTEPYTNKNKMVGLPTGAKVIYDRNSKLAVRAGIVATPDLNIASMESWCTRDCAVALIKIGGKQTLLISLYLDITLEVQPEWLIRLLKMAMGRKYPVIIGADSNAHSTLFGNDCNKRGEQLEDLILRFGLRVENKGEAPTFEVRRGDRIVQTSIDVTLTHGLRVDVRDWHVDRGYNASDHNTIRFKVMLDKSEPESIRPWGKADWTAFKTELKTDYAIPDAMSMKKLDRLVDRMYAALDKAMDKACPKIK